MNKKNASNKLRYEHGTYFAERVQLENISVKTISTINQKTFFVSEFLFSAIPMFILNSLVTRNKFRIRILYQRVKYKVTQIFNLYTAYFYTSPINIRNECEQVRNMASLFNRFQ